MVKYLNAWDNFSPGLRIDLINRALSRMLNDFSWQIEPHLQELEDEGWMINGVKEQSANIQESISDLIRKVSEMGGVNGLDY